MLSRNSTLDDANNATPKRPATSHAEDKAVKACKFKPYIQEADGTVVCLEDKFR